jgi:ribosomal protein S18 acetylase RimI-like enzyme
VRILRPATAADGRAIAEVHRASSVATYRPLLPDFGADYDIDERAAGWAEAATTPGRHLMVVPMEPDGTGPVLGFAASGPGRPEALAPGDDPAKIGEVYAVYVDPARHGEGIGRALMADALGWLAAAGYEFCVLWVAALNTRSRRFYEFIGFDPDEGVTDEWRGIATVRYRRRLSGDGN